MSILLACASHEPYACLRQMRRPVISRGSYHLGAELLELSVIAEAEVDHPVQCRLSACVRQRCSGNCQNHNTNVAEGEEEGADQSRS